MSNIWDEFDAAVDVEGLQADVKDAAAGSQDFKDVPDGSYEITIEKLEMGKSKKDRPMLKGWFKILAGEYKGQRIFLNQVIDVGFGVHKANEFMRSLDTGHDIEFVSFAQYHTLIENVKGKADECEFALSYTTNAKNAAFHDIEITDIYEVEADV